MDTPALNKLGVLYYHIPSLPEVDALAAERGYKNRDEIVVSPASMGDAYETKVKSFFAEHLHEDEEIRYIRDGAGYFDVRSEGDEWIRVRLEKAIPPPFFSFLSYPFLSFPFLSPSLSYERELTGLALGKKIG